MSVVPTEERDPVAALDSFYDEAASAPTTVADAPPTTPVVEPTPVTTETPQAAEPAPSADPWDTLLTPEDDEELSPSLRKIPLREYLNKTKRALVNEKRAGEEKNIAIQIRDRLLSDVARLEREVETLRAQSAQPQPKPIDSFAAAGFDPRRELWDAPDKFAELTSEIAKQKAIGAAQPHIERLESQLQEIQLGLSADKVRTATETARASLKTADGRPVSKAMFDRVLPKIAHMISQDIAAGHRVAVHDPEAYTARWAEAERWVRAEWGEFFTPSGAAPTPAPTPAPPRNVAPAPPVGAARSANMVSSSAPITISPRRAALFQPHLDAFNYNREQRGQKALSMEQFVSHLREKDSPLLKGDD